MKNLLIGVGVVPLLVSSALAQRDRGPVLGAHLVGAVGGSTFSSGGAVSAYRLYAKKAGFVPVAPPAVGVPDFRFITLFPDPSQPDGVRHITVDGMSTGRDYIRADATGRITTTGNQWLALLFSVQRRTGGTATGVIAQEEAAADGAGADVFSKGFGAIPATMALPRRVLDSTELDLYQSGHRGELLDFDVNMAAYELDPMITGRLPSQPFVFFTVSAADAINPSLTPDPWWGGPGGPRSGATILYKQWNGTSWSPPAVAFRYSDLGLDASDDIDGLSMESLGGGTWDIVFSTTVLSPRAPSQLMWARVGSGPSTVTTGVYRDSTGVPVSDQLDAGDGNLDGFCLYDPSFAQPGASNLLEGYIVGTPTAPLLPGTPGLDLAVWRNCPAGALAHSALVTGGPGTPDALFHFTVLGIITTAANVPIWETLALNRVVVRPTGAPATSDFLLPPPSLYPDLTSDVFVQHLVVSINLTTFALNDQAAPVQIRL